MIRSLLRGGRMSALALGLVLAAGPVIEAADARPSSGRSMGSRGSKTYSAPPPTATAPSSAQPMQRSVTQPGSPGYASGAAGAAPTAQRPRFGFGTGLMAGVLGAGLLGMLMGNGFFGGISGIASFLGLLLQIGLIVGLVMLALRFFRRRQEATATAASYSYTPPGIDRGVPGGLGGRPGGRPGGMPGPGAHATPVSIGPSDYADFERLLGEIQAAYGREDIEAVRARSTPEMGGYFSEELQENARQGVINELAQTKLLQGDLAEAWREGDTEYATVAMRYSLIDITRQRATGRIVAGDPNTPQEVTEVWTFRRDRGGPWRLSAIQQV